MPAFHEVLGISILEKNLPRNASKDISIVVSSRRMIFRRIT